MHRLRLWLLTPSLTLGLVAAVALPLAFHPGTYHAFELPKAMLLRALALAALVLAGIALARGSNRQGKALPLVIPALLLGLALLLSTALSVDRSLSVWGSYERQYGLLTQGGLLVLFVVVAGSLRERQHADRLWAALVWGSVPVVGYALLQAVGLDPFRWQTDGASSVLSTLGRSNFLGSYLVMILPLTISRCLLSRRRWPYALLLLGQLTSLFLSQARGAWLGFVLAGLTFALLWAAPRHRRWVLLGALVAAGLALTFTLLLAMPDGPLTGLQDLPGVDRVAALADTQSGSTAARLTIWRTTLSLLAERPWLGYGPDALRPAFTERFPPQLVYYQGRGLDVDRAHNLWLDLAISGGLVAVLAFGLVMASFVQLARRQLRGASSPEGRLPWIGLISLVAGHLVELQFSFETVATGAVFWLALALAVGLARMEGTEDAGLVTVRQLAGLRRRASMVAALPLVVVAVGLMFTLGLRPLMADVAYKKSLAGQLALADRVEAAERAVAWWSLEPEYRRGLADLLAAQGSYGPAVAQLAAAGRIRPNDARLWAALGRVHGLWAGEDPTQSLLARGAYERAVALAPHTASYHTALGAVLARRGQLELGAAQTEQAVELDATDVVAYRQLAAVYQALGRVEDALWADEQATYWSSRAEGAPD